VARNVLSERSRLVTRWSRASPGSQLIGPVPSSAYAVARMGEDTLTQKCVGQDLAELRAKLGLEPASATRSWGERWQALELKAEQLCRATSTSLCTTLARLKAPSTVETLAGTIDAEGEDRPAIADATGVVAAEDEEQMGSYGGESGPGAEMRAGFANERGGEIVSEAWTAPDAAEVADVLRILGTGPQAVRGKYGSKSRDEVVPTCARSPTLSADAYLARAREEAAVKGSQELRMAGAVARASIVAGSPPSKVAQSIAARSAALWISVYDSQRKLYAEAGIAEHASRPLRQLFFVEGHVHVSINLSDMGRCAVGEPCPGASHNPERFDIELGRRSGHSLCGQTKYQTSSAKGQKPHNSVFHDSAAPQRLNDIDGDWWGGAQTPISRPQTSPDLGFPSAGSLSRTSTICGDAQGGYKMFFHNGGHDVTVRLNGVASDADAGGIGPRLALQVACDVAKSCIETGAHPDYVARQATRAAQAVAGSLQRVVQAVVAQMVWLLMTRRRAAGVPRHLRRKVSPLVVAA